MEGYMYITNVIFLLQLFIDPLRKVTSSTSVNGLVKLCTTYEHRRFLQALGMTIGIKSWADDFRRMLSESHTPGYPASGASPTGDRNQFGNTSSILNVMVSKSNANSRVSIRVLLTIL